MVRVIRNPISIARKCLSANDIAGWPNGVRYEYRGRSQRRTIRIKAMIVRTVKVVPIKTDFTFE